MENLENTLKNDEATLPEVEQTQAELDQATILTLQAEVESEKDRALRAYAEMENFRRRSQQELDSFKKYASEKVILEFLPILDSFSLACDHAQRESCQKNSVIDGFVLIQRQLLSALERLQVTPIDAINEPFNPNSHQAISQQKSEDKASGTVIQEVQKGYKLHDRVIRPSLVIIAE